MGTGGATGGGERPGLTRVAGIRVGHATVDGGGSGCTVILGPFRAAAWVAGMATGTREIHTLDPEHLVPRADALLLTGGSAYGLAAADGVMAWLEERGQGFDTGVAPVPIVPAAVIFDLAPGRGRPGPTTGRAACDAAGGGTVREGGVGAGTGATVGTPAAPGGPTPGGVGSWSLEVGPYTVAALAVVNALGDVLDGRGRIVAGGRSADGSFVDTREVLLSGGAGSGPAREGGGEWLPGPGTQTTLCVVATDAGLGRVELARLARMSAGALPRRIRPVGTPFDGDVVFAVSPAAEEPCTPQRLLSLGEAAAAALEIAITRAVDPDARG